jgi:hypothetical protein
MQPFIMPTALTFQPPYYKSRSILFAGLITFIIVLCFYYYALQPISVLPSTTCILLFLMTFQYLGSYFSQVQPVDRIKAHSISGLLNWPHWSIELCIFLYPDVVSTSYQSMLEAFL